MTANQRTSEICERYCINRSIYGCRTTNVWLPSMSRLHPVRTGFSVMCPRLDEYHGNMTYMYICFKFWLVHCSDCLSRYWLQTMQSLVSDCGRRGGLMVSSDRAVRVRTQAENIALCSWAKHFTPTVPLSTQVYKWVPANLMLGVTLHVRCTGILS